MFIGGFEPVDYCPVSYPYYEEELDQFYYFRYNCNYGYNSFKSQGEVIGLNSLWFDSSLMPINNNIILEQMNSVCYEVICDRNKKEIKILIGDSYVICQTNGQF